MKWFFIFLIRLYQVFVSPFFGQRCRFYPSCSHYSLESLHKYGFLKGSSLSFKRIVRCHPWNPGGNDPVP